MGTKDEGLRSLRARFLTAMGIVGVAVTGCERRPEIVGFAPEPSDAAPTATATATPTASATATAPATATTPETASDAAPSTSATQRPSTPDAAASAAPKSGRALSKPIRVGREICVAAAGTQGTRAPGSNCGEIPGPQVWAADVSRPCGPCAFTFNAAATAKQRAVHSDACCYTGSSPSGPGRALRAAGGVLPAPRARRDWMDAVAVGRVSEERTREVARRAWLDAAALEHASIATFARLSLELLALGAPSDLVEGAHAAALDEIRHARQSYAIAASYGATEVGPAPLPAATASIETPTLERIACEALVDGCFGEAVAALHAERGAERADDAGVRRVLSGIAEDEARHAELAWRTVAWTLRRGGASVARALASAAASIDVTQDVEDAEDDEASVPTDGILSGSELGALRAEVLGQLVHPCLRALMVS